MYPFLYTMHIVEIELLLLILVYNILLNNGVRMWHMHVGLAWKVHMSEIKESQYIYIYII